MLVDLYQEYLHLIGTLKDRHKLDIEVDHRDIHTFYRNKKPLFKLFYGKFNKDEDASIVVSFHMDMSHAEAIQWFSAIYTVSPIVSIHDSFILDSSGETYLGEDALALKEVFQTQQILSKWLETSSKEEMEAFAKAPVTGRLREPNKAFDSLTQSKEATMEFDKVKKPNDDESVH